MATIIELMTKRSDRVAPGCLLGEVAALMVESRISSVIVVDQGKAIGIITECDMIRVMRQHQSPDLAASAIMSHPVHGVAANTEFRQAYRDAAALGIRHIVVNDAAGLPLGIVSEADFRTHLGADFFRHLHTVDTLMERLVPRLPASAKLDEALAAMEAVHGSCTVVVDGRAPLGIVTERDVVRLFLEGQTNPALGEIMSRPAISVGEDCSLAEAAEQMLHHGIRHLTVVDAAGQLLGLLSEHALMRPLKLDLVEDVLAEHQSLSRSRDRAQEETARNERYQRALLDNFPHLVWLKDTESRFLAVNRAYAEAVGAESAASLIGKTDFDVWAPARAENYRADDLAVMASREKKAVVEKIDRLGTPTWNETFKAPVVDDNGDLLGTVGFAQDISARRRNEEAILLRNAALAGLIRNEPIIGVLELIVLSLETEIPGWQCAIHLADSDGKHLRPFATPRLSENFAAAISPIPVEEGAGACANAAFWRQRVLIADIAGYQTKHPYWPQFREAARQAGIAACWAEPILGPQGELLGVSAAYNAIAGAPSDANQALLTQSSQLTALVLAHQRSAENLQNSLDTFHGIFDSSSEALFVQAADGMMLDANTGAERLFRQPREKLIGQTHKALGAPGLNDLAAIGRAVAEATAGKSQYFEYWCRDGEKRIFPVDVRLHPCTYFGQPVLIASVVDISERKCAELRLEIEHDMLQAIAAGMHRDEVLGIIIKAALRFPDLDAGGIYVRQTDGGYDLASHLGLSPAFATEIGRFTPESNQAQLIRDGQLVCCCNEPGPNCADSRITAAPVQEGGMRCQIMLPVSVAGEAIACLFLAGHRANQISPDTLQALEKLTGNIAQTLLRLDAQEEAERLQHNLGGLFNALTDFLVVTDAEGSILHYNRAVNETLGHAPGALLGRQIVAIHPEGKRALAQRYLAEMQSGQRAACSLPLLHADGSTIMSECRFIAGYWDGRPAWFGIFRDIRERLLAEERQKLAASVFDNAHEGIMITDPTGHIVEVNTTFTELTGYPREEVIGQTTEFLRSGHHDAAFYETMWQTIREAGYWRGEVWNRKKSGEILVELLTISTVRNRNGDISHFVGIFSDITLIKEHQKRLEHQAHFDALTQLPNRMLLSDRMHLAMAQTERNGKRLAVCYLDLDGFKPVNDRYGHAVGDKLLVDVAQRLKTCVRAGDTVSRLGGDEFVLLFSEIEDDRECDHTVNRVISQLTAPFLIAGQEISISASIGVTLYPQDGADSDTLLRHADQAMYAAKQAGRNRFHLFDPEHDRRAQQRREESGRIREALQRSEFVLYYQPKVNMRKGTVVGAEALIRWQHPQRGLLAPGQFLPAVEGSELSIAIGDWVIREALQQIAFWHRQGLEISVSVNIAGNHLQNAGFTQRLGELLTAYPDIPPHCLELEILETAALEDIGNVAMLFAECRHLGVNFSLDDFGTGYSSLTYFRRLPADVLKIDQSFVRDMLDDPDDLAIVEGVIGLTKAFDRKVIAEGVETPEHGLVLLQLGCDLAQGYGIARPMPAADFPAWVSRFRPHELWSSVTSFHWAREDFPLLVAEIDHRRWISELETYLADTTGQIGRPAEDAHGCRFGNWYHGPAGKRHGHIKSYAAIDAIHQRVHAIANELIALKDAGESTLIANRLAELQEASNQLTETLQMIQAEVLLTEDNE